MALATVQFSPSMTWEQLIAALNQNFALGQNQANTQIISDNDGVRRIIIGERPDGTFGLIISKPGIDIVSLYTTS